MGSRLKIFLMMLVFSPCRVVISNVDTSSEVYERNRHWGMHDAQDFDARSLIRIYENRPQSKVKNLPNLGRGFFGHAQWDEPIRFWLKFWKQKGYSIPIDDPLLIKAMIAVESNFELIAEPGVLESSAFGLMQITNQTRRILSGVPNPNGFTEVQGNRIHVSREDLSDGVVNIAVGIRWLAHKYEMLPYKSQFHMLKWYHSWDSQGEEYSRKVLSLYQESKPKKKIKKLKYSSRFI